jgi:hypothetical protein
MKGIDSNSKINFVLGSTSLSITNILPNNESKPATNISFTILNIINPPSTEPLVEYI